MIFKIEQNVAQAMLDYLATQPYKEVFQLVNALQSLEEIKEPVQEATVVEPQEETSTSSAL